MNRENEKPAVSHYTSPDQNNRCKAEVGKEREREEVFTSRALRRWMLNVRLDLSLSSRILFSPVCVSPADSSTCTILPLTLIFTLFCLLHSFILPLTVIHPCLLNFLLFPLSLSPRFLTKFTFASGETVQVSHICSDRVRVMRD